MYRMNKEILLSNIDKLHTIDMGNDRIKRNLELDDIDIVSFIKDTILDNKCEVYKKGKNWYVLIDGIKITINSYSYTIITAHML